MTHPSILKTIFSRRMIVAALMGFNCGLPLLLTTTLLQAWMKESGVDLEIIGLMALVGLPYTLKFLWAPIMDRFSIKILGRRRGWLLASQISLMASIAALGLTNPSGSTVIVAWVASLVAFFSASQDIVVDAYRREDLNDEELGLGASLYVWGYRVGMLLASGGGLVLADQVSFPAVYFIMAGCTVVGPITTVLTPEPDTPLGAPQSMREAVFEPFIEYFTRRGAIWMLAFILFYKIGDQMAGALLTPFFLDLGFTKTIIGTVFKFFGFGATIAGGFIGGIIILRLGIHRSLWFFGILQALSTAGFAVLAHLGPRVPALAVVVGFENLTAGMGTSAFLAFMSGLTNKRFTATQYALLSSLMGVPRVAAAAPTGFLVNSIGWFVFFIFCTLMAVPGLLLLLKFQKSTNGSDRGVE